MGRVEEVYLYVASAHDVLCARSRGRSSRRSASRQRAPSTRRRWFPVVARQLEALLRLQGEAQLTVLSEWQHGAPFVSQAAVAARTDSCSMGKRMKKVVPLPSSLSKVSSPWCFSTTTERAMAKP